MSVDFGACCRQDTYSPMSAARSSQMQVILGVSIGIVLAFCVGLLLYLARRNPKRIKKIAISFLRACHGLISVLCLQQHCLGTETKLALKILAEVQSPARKCPRRIGILFRVCL